MGKLTGSLLFASILFAGALTAPFVYAQSNQEPTGSTMDHGMMGNKNTKDEGGMGMMKQMSQMMDHCSNMMSDNRPNDQWRKSTPSEPEKKG